MSTQVQYRRGTASENNSFTGALAEITVDTTNSTLRVHDGVTAGGSNIATVSYVTAQLAATNALTNGTSNVQIPSSGSNIRVNVGGTSNVAVFATTGATINGDLTVTGNATLSGNILGDRIVNGTTELDIQVSGGNANLTVGGTSNVVVWATTGEYVTGLVSATGNIIAGTDLYVGTGATTAGFTTAPIIVGRDSSSTYTQVAIQNASGAGSADITTYANNGTEAQGWMDMGITGNTFSDTNYTITGANDGYLFAQGNTSFGGNLVIATGNTGTTRDIVFGFGFLSTNEFLRFSRSGNAIIPYGNATANIGNTTNQFNTVFAKATSAQYADLAEYYKSDADYPPGTVVVFGGAEEITISNKSHDTRVAGVISTQPAYVMNSSCPGLPVALTGRVPCQVQGPVAKGDVLVTGTALGIAQKIGSEYQPGCVLGKSLGEIADNSVSVIEVVVGRF
jgi:hypothetical protein